MVQRSSVIAACRKIIFWSLLATVFFVPIYFAWFQENFNVFDLNKTLALRFFLGAASVAWLLRFCLSARTHWAAGARAAGAGLLVAIAFALSTIFSLHPLISLFGSYERQQGLLNLWHYLLLFFLMADSVRSRADAEKMIAALLAGSALASAYGLVQAFGLDFFAWGESSQVRIFSTFGQPNFFGHYLATLLPLTVYAVAYLGRNFYLRLSYCLLGAAELVCLICTYSRGAWIAAALTLAAFAGWELWRRGRKKTVSTFLAAIVAVIVLVNVSGLREGVIRTLPVTQGGAVQRLVSLLQPFSGSGYTRLLYWKAAVSIMREAPLRNQLFGYGPDVQGDAYVPFYRPEWAYYEQMNSYPDRAHNFILDVPLQFGFAGAALLAFFMGLIAWRLIRFTGRRSGGPEYWLGVALLSALLAYALNNIFSFSLTGMNTVLYALLGLAATAGGGFSPAEKSWHFFQSFSRWLISAVAVFLILILFYGQALRPYIADYYYFKVKKAEARQDCRGVIDTMERVIEWYPSSHFYQRNYLHHGTNCFSAVTSEAGKRQLAGNLLEMAEAIPVGERQYQTLIKLSQMYSIVGFEVDSKYYADAEAIYRQLISINPYITTNYQDYGRLKLWQMKNEEAIAIFKQGIAAAPTVENAPAPWHIQAIRDQLTYFHELIGTAYQEEKKFDEADAWYQKTLSISPNSKSTYKKLADLYYKKGDIQGAIRYNKRGFELEPDSNLWPFGLAALYKELGDFPQALTYARQALALDPGNAKIEALIKELQNRT